MVNPDNKRCFNMTVEYWNCEMIIAQVFRKSKAAKHRETFLVNVMNWKEGELWAKASYWIPKYIKKSLEFTG